MYHYLVGQALQLMKSNRQNTVCTADSGLDGVCYTTEECEDRSGTSSGTCAEGYGVCCTSNDVVMYY